jgi:hypothetical protein
MGKMKKPQSKDASRIKPMFCYFCGKPNPEYRLEDARGIFKGTRWACETCMVEQVFEKRNCKLRIDLF